MPADQEGRRGACLCGAIVYVVQGEPEFVMQCFCRDCQKSTGTGHTTIVGVLADRMTVTGTPTVYTTHGETGGAVHRHFCGVCGSRLYTSCDLSDPVVMIQAGTLDEPGSVTPTIALYLKDKAHWDSVDATLEQFDAMFPIEQRPEEVWRSAAGGPR